MKKKIIPIIIIIFLASIFLLMKPSITENAVAEEKIKLGYCPTMQEEVIYFFNKGNYELIQFNFASEVLNALKNNQIDRALIGRKAELSEINEDTKETVLKSGYTLVSNGKGFVDISQISSLEIYTYLEEDFNFSIKKISKQEVLEKVSGGKIVLISWEDWNDDYELIVVMNGNEKVKEFRGVFLYEN